MPTVELSSGDEIRISGDKATIGSNPNCTVVISDDPRIARRHAVIKKVASRWMIESMSESLITTDENHPGRICWLQDFDHIQLTTEGPELIFRADQPDHPKESGQTHLKSTNDDTSQQSLTNTTPPPELTIEDRSAQLNTAPGKSASDHSLARSAPADSGVYPHSSGPITINVSGNQSGASSAILWMGGIFLFLILLLIVLFLVPQLSGNRNSIQNQEDPEVRQLIDERNKRAPQVAGQLHPEESKKNHGIRPRLQNMGNAVVAKETPVPVKKVLPVNPEEAIYVVLAQDRQSQVFLRIGTAFAVSKNKLATSGSVGVFINRNKAHYPLIQIHSASNKNEIYTVSNSVLLPEYETEVETSYELARELRQLQEHLENSTTLPSQKEINQLKQKMEQLKDRMFQSVEHLICLDVAILEVQEELPVFLELADQLPAPNKELSAIGAPFIQEEAEFIPGESQFHVQKNPAYLIRDQDFKAGDLSRLLVKCKGEKLSAIWVGSPFLNAKNQVVGVYSRPAPGKDLSKMPTGEFCDVPTVDQIRKIIDAL